MTLEGHTCICGRHSLPIISDGNGLSSSSDDFDLYLGSSCVDGVLYQLLDQIGWCRHYLACCDLIGKGLGE